MHMISTKDLSEVEMDILTKSCSPTIVITANGEVPTQEEAIVYVKELNRDDMDSFAAESDEGRMCPEARVEGVHEEFLVDDEVRALQPL